MEPVQYCTGFTLFLVILFEHSCDLLQHWTIAFSLRSFYWLTWNMGSNELMINLCLSSVYKSNIASSNTNLINLHKNDWNISNICRIMVEKLPKYNVEHCVYFVIKITLCYETWHVFFFILSTHFSSTEKKNSSNEGRSFNCGTGALYGVL